MGPQHVSRNVRLLQRRVHGHASDRGDDARGLADVRRAVVGVGVTHASSFQRQIQQRRRHILAELLQVSDRGGAFRRDVVFLSGTRQEARAVVACQQYHSQSGGSGQRAMRVVVVVRGCGAYSVACYHVVAMRATTS